MKKTRISLICCVLAGFFGLTACANSGSVKELAKETQLSGYTVVYPERISGALNNPGMGWIALEEQTGNGKMDLGASGQLPEVDNIGIQTSWALIERNEGVFDWSLIDRTIDYWTARGKRINFRICTDSLSLPEVYFGAPKWLYDDYGVKFKLFSYGSTVNQTRVTDLTDANYQHFFERFMTKLSERYKNNPYIDTIDIRGFGEWGEWHSGYGFADMDERIATLGYIIDKYVDAFDAAGKTLFLSCSWDFQGANEDGSNAIISDDTPYLEYVGESAFDHAMSLENVSFRRDGGAGNGVVRYAHDERLMADVFRSGKKVAQIAEFFTGYDAYLPKNGVYPYDMTPVEAVDELMFKMHANYSTVMGWVNIEVANIIDDGSAEIFNRGNEIMGYRLAVDSAKWSDKVETGGKLDVVITMSNSGTGRFTLNNHNLKVALTTESGKEVASVINQDFDLRTLVSGEVINIYSVIDIPQELKQGKYNISVSIVDANGNNAIRLANEGDYAKRIYPLGEVGVTSDNVKKSVNAYTEYASLGDVKLADGKFYALTFQYTPAFALKDYVFGDSDGYRLMLGNKTIMSWQDVSMGSTYKTVVVQGNKNSALTVDGTGKYAGKITSGKVYVEEVSGYYEDFDGYDLNDIKSPFYGVLDDSVSIVSDVLDGDALLLEASTRRNRNDILTSDNKILKLAAGANYTVSFDFQGVVPGSNGAFMYVALNYGDGKSLTVAEWYNRPDEGKLNKVFNFTVPQGADDGELVLGMKNRGSYAVDNLLIIRNASGKILEGTDLAVVNNQRPDFSGKGVGFLEDFEDNNLNASAMKYGFDRLGLLTTDVDEVINGKVSFTSRTDKFAVPFYTNGADCWMEFSYSNPEIVTLKPNTQYSISLLYKVLEAPESAAGRADGRFYMLLRSQSGKAPDSAVINFGSEVTDGVQELSVALATGDADDYRVVIGMYHYGVLIYDDILINEMEL